ncbi:O-methyltransferase [Burkholderia cepacia]|uniref:O-methyltransferase n=1 Tax=Burkholderia cepacia TaxID=292 RepID=UPI003EE0F24E
MSGGGSIPYHLRQNKAIERNLFIDLLSRIGRYVNISDYTYVGFGGPFLEDFKHLHSALRIEKMFSIEYEENVYYRQVFNQPVSCVNLLHMSSGDFIYRHDFTPGTIVWFDYASPSSMGEQLSETQRLVEKLNHADIFKITLNADPQTLGTSSNDEPLLSFRRGVAADRLGDYAPATMDDHSVARGNYPKLLLAALLNAARHGLRAAGNLCLQPLTSFSYKDGQQMLTFTGIILSQDKREEFLKKTRLESWKFSNLECVSPMPISVPAFSVKERLFVESLLPANMAENIIDKMGYTIDDNINNADTLMKNFVEFYRLYPWYSRVVL